MKSPGGYQVRAAVQDARSKAVGSSAQFVEVPKVGKGQLALSGVVMMDVASGRGRRRRGVATDTLSDGVLGEPAVKIFRPGSEVAYTCEIYDGRGGTDGFATTATLLRDGRPIFTSPAAPVAGADRGAAAVRASRSAAVSRWDGSCRPAATPFRYRWHGRPRPTRAHATQWTEFEVR